MLLAEVERAVEALGLRDRGVLLAVSGGRDSTVLAHAMLEIARGRRLKLWIGHVNHGLRGSESEADQAVVERLAGKLGLGFSARRVDPEALRSGRSSRERPTLQEAARHLRYEALRAMADEAGCRHLATAHHADDQAETVLLRLLRGTGPDGIGGIPERSADGVVVRPLLRVPGRAVESYARQRGLDWREDPSNDKTEYARNRLRHRWLPGLTDDFNPQLLRAIGDLAEAQRRDTAWIASLVEREAAVRFSAEDGWLAIREDDWSGVPEALARRLMRWALAECGGARDASRVHLGRMLAFLRTGRRGGYIELPGGVRLEKGPRGTRIGPLA